MGAPHTSTCEALSSNPQVYSPEQERGRKGGKEGVRNLPPEILDENQKFVIRSGNSILATQNQGTNIQLLITERCKLFKIILSQKTDTGRGEAKPTTD